MPPPKRTYLRDLDAEERVDMRSAAGEGESGESQEQRLSLPSQEFSKIDGVPIPKPEDLLDAQSALEWVNREALKATPRALQEVIHQMKTSDKKTRLIAALKLLDRAAEHTKNNAVTVAPVIILTKESMENIPWVRQAKSTGKIVDGELVEPLHKVIPGGSQG